MIQAYSSGCCMQLWTAASETPLQEAAAALLWQWLPIWHHSLFVRTQVSTRAAITLLYAFSPVSLPNA